jgi:hypothetical protein
LILDKGRLFSHLVSDEDLAIFPTRDGGIMFFADVLDAGVEAVKSLRAREMVVPFALNLLVPGLSSVAVPAGQDAQDACLRDHIPGNKMPEVEDLIGIPHANWCTGRFEKEAWTYNGRPVYKSTKKGTFKGTNIVNVADGSHETQESEQEIQCWLWWFPDEGRPRDNDDMTTDGDPSRRGWWLTPDHPPLSVAQIPYLFALRELERPEGKKPVVGKIARAYAFRPTGLEDDDSFSPPAQEWRVRSSLNRGAEKMPNDHFEEYECDKWKPEWGVTSNEMTVTTALDEAADA